MSVSKQFLWVIASLVCVGQAWAQVANSPFTQSGIGQTYTDALANTQGMGGVGVSNPQYWYVNNQNPALLVYNTITTIQAGILGESVKTTNGTSVEKNRGGNMNYLVMAFPALRSKKRPSIITWTTSTGLMPYSSLNYKIQYLATIDGSQLLAPTTEQGTGGLTQLYWSNGVRINKNFSVGLKATYLFGSLTRAYRGQATYVSTGELKNTVKGLNFSLGGSFTKDSLFGKDYRISVGAVYQLAADPRAHLKNKTAQLDNRGDTLSSVPVSTTYGSMHLPASITAGVSFGTTKWTIGTEFHYQDWSSFQSLNAGEAKDSGQSWRMAAGGELTPNQFAPENLLQRLTYRIGGSIEQYPFLGNGQPIKDVGINFGLSVPAGKSSMDLGFKIGKRGDTSKNILEENYFKLFFGITFNDQWFIKRRFD